MSKTSSCEQYGTGGITLLSKWLAEYESVVKEVSLAPCRAPTDISDQGKEGYHDENARFREHVKELERAFTFSRLETETCDLVITRVEEYFNTPIRRKPGAK